MCGCWVLKVPNSYLTSLKLMKKKPQEPLGKKLLKKWTLLAIASDFANGGQRKFIQANLGIADVVRIPIPYNGATTT